MLGLMDVKTQDWPSATLSSKGPLWHRRQEAQIPGDSWWPSTSTEQAGRVLRSKKKSVGDMKPLVPGGKHVKTK